MSKTPALTASSSNFHAIFVASLKEYEKKTMTDLHTHPLAAQLQSCDSSSDILAILHDKIDEFDQHKTRNQRLFSWLNPTINVLYAFSATLGEGVGLVSLNARLTFLTILIVSTDILTRKSNFCRCWDPPPGEYRP